MKTAMFVVFLADGKKDAELDVSHMEDENLLKILRGNAFIGRSHRFELRSEEHGLITVEPLEGVTT